MGGFYYYGIDSLYIYLVVPAIIIMLWSQIRVKTVFSKYSTHHSPLTGADAARRVLEANGVYNVKIERVSGNLTDHYDPRTNVIRLSDSVYGANNLSAVGVAAHEAGHAVQYSKGYVPIKVRSVILPVCNLGSQLSMPLLIIGLIFDFYFLVKLGVIFFCVALLFQLLTDDFSYGTYILVRTQLILLLLRNVLTDIQCNRNNDNDTLCDILVVRVDAKELQTGL